MSNYTKTTDFAAKDALLTGDPSKLVKGTEINVEFSNIQTAVNSKLDSSGVTAFAATLLDDANAATARGTLGAAASGAINIKDYGGSAGASAATNTAALQAAIAEAVVKGKGGVEIGPGGTWAFTAGVNYATRDIAILGVGRPILDFSAGTGKGFLLDAGGAGANIRGMRVENFIIKGGPNITNGFEHRGMVGATFRNIEVRECNNIGFELRFGVLNTYENLRVSNDSLAMTTTPVYYFRLNDDGTGTGNRCQCNTFINCDASGKGATSTSTGWALANAILNNWVGGTAESLKTGVDIQSDICQLNTFRNFDMEDNVDHDVIVKGYGNTFEDCTSQSSTAVLPNIDITTGAGTQFRGGYLRWVNLGASSSNTNFIGSGIEENVSVGIKGTGTHRKFGCTKIGAGGVVTGALPDQRMVNETASRALATNYTNTGSGTVRVSAILTLNSNAVAQALVDGVVVATLSNDGSLTKDNTIVFDVPGGSVMRIDQIVATVTLSSWMECKV